MERSSTFIIRRVGDVLASLPAELERPWTASELSARVGISESHFRRACLALTGEPPMRYLKRLRLTAAAALLCSSGLSVKEVAGSVGFRDLSHFVRDFRCAHGRSPSSFRLDVGRVERESRAGES
jgi:AraC-like DNA-binding protein